MSLTTYREVCNELLNGLDELRDPRYPFPGYTTAAMDRARELLAQPALAEPPVFALQWSENKPPGEECRYDHCTAQTPFGDFLITWKSWKKYDYPTVDKTPWGDFWQAFATVQLAKAACQREFDAKIEACVMRTQPPHPTPARLRHCPTHGQQPPEAWGCPECVRELREELEALRAVIAADRARRAAPPPLLDLANPTADTAVAMMYALRDAELSGKPKAIGLANALHELLVRHQQPVRITNKGKHNVVFFTDIALIITYLCYNKHT